MRPGILTLSLLVLGVLPMSAQLGGIISGNARRLQGTPVNPSIATSCDDADVLTWDTTSGSWLCSAVSGSGLGDVTGGSDSAAGELAAYTNTTGKSIGRTFTIFTGPASTPKTFTFPNANASVLTTNDLVTVAQGGTGLASGTSGGIPYFSGTTTIASSGALTANMPVLGGGAGNAPTVGTRSGNTTEFATVTGSKTTGKQLAFDASGNVIASAEDIGGGGGGGFANPMTTAEDIIKGGTDGAATRLAVGSEGQVLKVVSGTVAWGTDSTGGTPAFSDIASGTNSAAAMVVGTGASLGVSGSGTIAATTAAALAANPADCSAGQYATTIAANGDLTCAQVAYSQVSSTPTLGDSAALNVGTTAGTVAAGDDARFHDAVTLAGTPDYITLSGQQITRNAINLATSHVTGILPGANGGTGNGFFAVTGPTTSLKTFTFPNASATVLTTDAAVTVAQGGTGLATITSNRLVKGAGTSAVVVTGVEVDSSDNVTTPGSVTATTGITTGDGSTPGVWTSRVNATDQDAPAADYLRLYPKADGWYWRANGGSAEKLRSGALKRGFGYSFGDATGDTLTARVSNAFRVPYACTITDWSISVDAGTATAEVWRAATGTAIPTDAGTINTSGIAISSGTHVYSTTLTDFTSTAIAANDIIRIELSAVATAKFVTVQIGCEQ